ncbi:MAG: hypothetical protein ACTSXF_15875 [Promethearchaeota archaeon]
MASKNLSKGNSTQFKDKLNLAASSILFIFEFAFILASLGSILFHMGWIFRGVSDVSYLAIFLLLIGYPLLGIIFMFSGKTLRFIFIFLNILWLSAEFYMIIMNFPNYILPDSIKVNSLSWYTFFDVLGKIVFLIGAELGDVITVKLTRGDIDMSPKGYLDIITGSALITPLFLLISFNLARSGWLFCVNLSIFYVLIGYILRFYREYRSLGTFGDNGEIHAERESGEGSSEAFSKSGQAAPRDKIETNQKGSSLKTPLKVIFIFFYFIFGVAEMAVIFGVPTLMASQEFLTRYWILFFIALFASFSLFLFVLKAMARKKEQDRGEQAPIIAINIIEGQGHSGLSVMKGILIQVILVSIFIGLEAFYTGFHLSFQALIIDGAIFGTIFLIFLVTLAILMPPKYRLAYFYLISLIFITSLILGRYLGSIPMKSYSELLDYIPMVVYILIFLTSLLIILLIPSIIRKSRQELKTK